MAHADDDELAARRLSALGRRRHGFGISWSDDSAAASDPAPAAVSALSGIEQAAPVSHAACASVRATVGAQLCVSSSAFPRPWRPPICRMLTRRYDASNSANDAIVHVAARRPLR